MRSANGCDFVFKTNMAAAPKRNICSQRGIVSRSLFSHYFNLKVACVSEVRVYFGETLIFFCIQHSIKAVRSSSSSFATNAAHLKQHCITFSPKIYSQKFLDMRSVESCLSQQEETCVTVLSRFILRGYLSETLYGSNRGSRSRPIHWNT